MKERVISEKLIQDALHLPTKVSVDQDGTWLYKKTYTKFRKVRLVIIAGNFIGKKFKIFTVIETSKVKNIYEEQ